MKLLTRAGPPSSNAMLMLTWLYLRIRHPATKHLRQEPSCSAHATNASSARALPAMPAMFRRADIAPAALSLPGHHCTGMFFCKCPQTANLPAISCSLLPLAHQVTSLASPAAARMWDSPKEKFKAF